MTAGLGAGAVEEIDGEGSYDSIPPRLLLGLLEEVPPEKPFELRRMVRERNPKELREDAGFGGEIMTFANLLKTNLEKRPVVVWPQRSVLELMEQTPDSGEQLIVAENALAMHILEPVADFDWREFDMGDDHQLTPTEPLDIQEIYRAAALQEVLDLTPDMAVPRVAETAGLKERLLYNKLQRLTELMLATSANLDDLLGNAQEYIVMHPEISLERQRNLCADILRGLAVRLFVRLNEGEKTFDDPMDEYAERQMKGIIDLIEKGTLTKSEVETLLRMVLSIYDDMNKKRTKREGETPAHDDYSGFLKFYQRRSDGLGDLLTLGGF